MSVISPVDSDSREPRFISTTSALAWALGVLPLSGLVVWSVLNRQEMASDLKALLPWIAVCIGADLIAVPLWENVVFSLSLPVLLAVGILFSPPMAGVVAIVGSADWRELRGEVSLARGLANRGQTALSVMAASITFHALGEPDSARWLMVLAVVAALLADLVVNTTFVVAMTASMSGKPARQVVGRLALGSPFQFMASYLCLGLLGAVLALLYLYAGLWGLILGLGPIMLAGQMLARSREALEAMEESRRKDAGLVAATRRMAEERKDERRVLAGSLHDEVLPPLYQVHLLTEVVRRDLESGNLLDMEKDVPALLEATRVTADVVRCLMGDLRKSQLGAAGMIPSLRVLTRELEAQGSAAIRLRLESLPSNPLVELVIYQVIREALVNAVRHGNARVIDVSLDTSSDGFRLLVSDDGDGFDVEAGEPEGHFGLTLMRERVEALGGRLILSSSEAGTRVVVTLPESPLLA